MGRISKSSKEITVTFSNSAFTAQTKDVVTQEADAHTSSEWNLCNLEAAQNQIIRMDKVKSQE